jgi:hypothetical protein
MCKEHKKIGHLCYMKKLKLPKSDNVLFVIYDFETTPNTKFSESATHVPNLVCLQQFCSQFENESDIKCGLSALR